MPITLAIVSAAFGDRSVSDTLDVARRNDFRAIELHGKHHAAHQLTADDVAAIRDAATNDGVTFNMHFDHNATPATPDAALLDDIRSRFRRDLDLLANVGGKVIVVHPGYLYHPEDDDPRAVSPEELSDSASRFIDFLRSVSADTVDAGVMVAVENQHFGNSEFVRSYSDLADAVDAVDDGNTFVALDVGHCIIGTGLPDALAALGPRIRHLHLNDAVDGVEHRELGVGVLDLDELGTLLAPEWDIAFAAIEAGFYDDDAEGVAVRSRDLLRSRFGDKFR